MDRHRTGVRRGTPTQRKGRGPFQPTPKKEQENPHTKGSRKEKETRGPMLPKERNGMAVPPHGTHPDKDGTKTPEGTETSDVAVREAMAPYQEGARAAVEDDPPEG